MRLLRVGKPATRVADDIRASLTALGRGDADVGGIALVDVKPTGTTETFDAVLVMPHGIVIVAGVDLPGPALRLEAPLRGQWKADNWPLVGSGGGDVNPASGALAAADALASRLNTLTNMAVPVGLVLAVGPFVDNVVTVPMRGEAVQVVYPTPARLRDAISSLAPEVGRPCSVEQARAVLRLIDPEVPIQSDEVLSKEGFATGAAYAHAAAASPALAAHAPTTPVQPPAPVTPATQPTTAATAKAAALAAAAQAVQPSLPPRGGPSRADYDDRPTDLMPLPITTQPAEPQRKRGPELRLLPIAAVLLVVAGLVAAILMATGSGADDTPQQQKGAQADKPKRYAISGVAFTEVASAVEQQCDTHTYGDVQAAMQKTPCTGMRLGSFLATVSERQAAVSVAVVDFAEPAQAEGLKKLADKAGSGGAADAANMTEKWPEGKLSFHNAVYRSEIRDSSVVLVRTAWLGAPSAPDDKLLARVATTSFEVEVD